MFPSFMTLFFSPINFDENYDLFLHYRKSAHLELEGAEEIKEEVVKDYIRNNLKNFGELAFQHILLSNNKIIGQIEIGTKSNYGYVYFFYLEPSYRGKGFFKQMHKQMVEIMQKKGFNTVMLSTPRSNKKAIEIYQKYGWRITGVNKKKEGILDLRLEL